MPDRVDFFVLNELLLNMGAVCSPSELQGVLCGRVSGGDIPTKAQWPADAASFLDLEEHLGFDDEQLPLIDGLYTDTRSLMDDVNFGFTPLLPGDEATMERRTNELASWCEGFLHGLGLSGLSGEVQLSPDVADALRDLAQISQVSVDKDDDLEENEVYWLELVEYVKVAVLTIYTELSNTQSSDSDKAPSVSGNGPSGSGKNPDQVIH